MRQHLAGNHILASLPLIASRFDWTAGVCKILVARSYGLMQVTCEEWKTHSTADGLSEVDETGHGGFGSRTSIEV